MHILISYFLSACFYGGGLYIYNVKDIPRIAVMRFLSVRRKKMHYMYIPLRQHCPACYRGRANNRESIW